MKKFWQAPQGTKILSKSFVMNRETVRKGTVSFPWVTLLLIFLAMLPVTMIVPVYKEIIKDRLGGSNYGVAWFQSYAMLGSFVFSPLAGWFSDKLGSRRILISLFAFIDAILLCLLPLMPDLPSLFFLRFLEGWAHIFVIGLLLTCLSDLEKDPESKFFNRGILFGLGGTLLTLGGGIGQSLGFLGNTNPILPFFVGGGILILLSLFAFFLLEESKIQQRENISFDKSGFFLKLSPLLIIPVIFHFIDRFTVGYFLSSLNLHLREDLGFTPGKVGGLFGIMFLLMSLLSLPAALLARRWSSIFLIWIGSLLYGIAQASTGVFNDSFYLTLSMIGCGIGAGLMYVPAMRLASSLSPVGRNGLVMTVFTGLGSLGFLLGPIVSIGVENGLIKFIGKTNAIAATGIFFGSLEIFLVFATLPFMNRILNREKNF